MPGEREESSGRLARFIVDVLRDAEIIGAADIAQAERIAAQEIDANKAMGDYWCSWCGLRAETSPGVRIDEETIRLAADGIELQLRRVGRADEGGRIAVEIQARAGSFSGCYTTGMRVADLLRFASELRDVYGASSSGGIATLRNVAGDAVIELTSSNSSRHLIQIRNPNGVTTMLTGSFIADVANIAALARELTSLVHDSWSKA